MKSSNQSGQKALLGYLPSIVIKNILDDTISSSTVMPASIPMKKVVSLFADISGFTKLSESFSKVGRTGSEFLAFCLNRYMEQLINVIGNNGGDIFKFAGDALLVIWPEEDEKDETKREANLISTCRRAIQCALSIQNKLNNLEMVKGKILSVKVGIGLGDCKVLFVGGVLKRNEYLIVGEAMRQACASECHCHAGGETVVSQFIKEKLKDVCEFEEAEPDYEHGDNDGIKYYKCTSSLKYKIATKAESLLMRTKFSTELIRKKFSVLKTYVPAAITLYLDIGKEIWSKENRLLTIMFLNLSIDLRDTETEARMVHIQKVIETVQKCVYRTRGSLNKFLMDDKGSVMLIVWGLPPLSAHDDAVRAVRTGIDIVKELRPLQCGAKIGITTGCCFTGVCGNIGARREYSLLGEIVNKSARYMQMSMTLCKEKLEENPNDVSANYQITLCEETKHLIENKIQTKWICKAPIKGFANPFDFYEPVIVEEQYSNVICQEIRTHNDNPRKDLHIPEKANEDSVISSAFMIGNDSQKKILRSVLDEVYTKKQSKTVIINGIIGSGKSLLLRHVISKFFSDNKLEIKPKNKIIFSSCQNPSIAYKPGNGIYQMLNEMYKAIEPLLNKEKTKVTLAGDISVELDEIGSMLNDSLCLSYAHYIEEILEVDLSSHYNLDEYAQKVKELFGIKPLEEREVFQKREYPQSYLSKFSEFFFKIVKLYKENIIPDKILIIIIEDCHIIDQVSYEFIRYLTIKNKTEDEMIPQVAVLCTFQEPINPYEINKLDNYEFIDSVILFNGLEDDLERYILDYILIKKKIGVVRIDPKILDIIITRVQTHSPLMISEVINSLMDQQYLRVVDFELTSGKDFIEISNLLDWSSIKIPFLIEKVIGNIIDSLSPIEIIVLKHASVIGTIFDIETLFSIISVSNLTFEDLIQMLYSFHYNQIIDILYDLDVNKIIAKFSIPFLREVFNQRMTVEQRSAIHLDISRRMQVKKSNYLSRKQELFQLKFHLREGGMSILDHISCSKQRTIDLGTKSKKLWILKEICEKLKVLDLRIEEEGIELSKRTLPIINSCICYKKSNTNVTWSPRFIIVTKEKFIYWYSKENYNNNMSPLGYFMLKDIYGVSLRNDFDLINHRSNILKIKVTSYVKKDEIKDSRTFYFSMQSEDELYQWITCLNFLRVKALYDQLSFNFGTIPLPLSHESSISTKSRKFKRHFQLLAQTNLLGTLKSNCHLSAYYFNSIKLIKQQNETKKKMSVFSRYFYETPKDSLIEKTFQEKKDQIVKLIKIGFIHFLGNIQQGISNESELSELIKIPVHLKKMITDKYVKKVSLKKYNSIINEADEEEQ